MGSKDNRFPLFCVFLFLVVLIVSAINPKDYFTWFLEVFPALIALVLLALTYRSFRLTNFLYGLILLHSIILMVGGHYTYAEVPLGDWARGWFGLERNNYDKVGHFAQGFIPAIVIREIFIRKQVVSTKGWRNFIIVCVCLAISAGYEFIEWFVAAASGQEAEAFLGTQGYVWDTQSDMLCATLGAIAALVVLAKWHNAQLKRFVLN